MQTEYAAAERKNVEEILRENREILDIPVLRDVLNQLPHLLMVINAERQLVFSNPALYHSLGLRDYQEILGARPGEILECKNAWLNEGGCGTGLQCQYCGAIDAVLTAQRTHEPAKRECRLGTYVNGKEITRFLEVHANPYKTANSEYYIISVNDISARKEKEFLEKAFFHDVNNLFTLLLFNLTDFPFDGLTHEQQVKFEDLSHITDLVVDQFRAQQDINRLLGDELPRHRDEINTQFFLDESVRLIKIRVDRKNIAILQDPQQDNLIITNDRVILQRVMLNLLKNAYEACDEWDTIRVGCRQEGNDVILWVHTPTEIPAPVRARLFEFGTSTKGVGRGIGLYSAKLFTEHILRGSIDFDSFPKGGTTFYIILPLSLPAD